MEVLYSSADYLGREEEDGVFELAMGDSFSRLTATPYELRRLLVAFESRGDLVWARLTRDVDSFLQVVGCVETLGLVAGCFAQRAHELAALVVGERRVFDRLVNSSWELCRVASVLPPSFLGDLASIAFSRRRSSLFNSAYDARMVCCALGDRFYRVCLVEAMSCEERVRAMMGTAFDSSCFVARVALEEDRALVELLLWLREPTLAQEPREALGVVRAALAAGKLGTGMAALMLRYLEDALRQHRDVSLVDQAAELRSLLSACRVPSLRQLCARSFAFSDDFERKRRAIDALPGELHALVEAPFAMVCSER